jgi:hypothetical protein
MNVKKGTYVKCPQKPPFKANAVYSLYHWDATSYSPATNGESTARYWAKLKKGRTFAPAGTYRDTSDGREYLYMSTAFGRDIE